MNIPQTQAAAAFAETLQEAMVDHGIRLTDRLYLTVTNGAGGEQWFTVEQVRAIDDDWHLEINSVR